MSEQTDDWVTIARPLGARTWGFLLAIGWLIGTVTALALDAGLVRAAGGALPFVLFAPCVAFGLGAWALVRLDDLQMRVGDDGIALRDGACERFVSFGDVERIERREGRRRAARHWGMIHLG